MNECFAKCPPRLQSGVTILEFIAFIGLAALVIAGALLLYNSGSVGSKAKEFFTGLNSVALGAKQLAGTGNNQNVAAAAISSPSSWQRSGNDWTYDGATIAFTNNNDGSFSLQVSGLSSADLARQLAGKEIFGKPGVLNGDTGVNWNGIKFQ